MINKDIDPNIMIRILQSRLMNTTAELIQMHAQAESLAQQLLAANTPIAESEKQLSSSGDNNTTDFAVKDSGGIPIDLTGSDNTFKLEEKIAAPRELFFDFAAKVDALNASIDEICANPDWSLGICIWDRKMDGKPPQVAFTLSGLPFLDTNTKA